MFKLFSSFITGLIILVFLSGCGAAPIKRDIVLPPQKLTSQPDNKEQSKVVVFNDSNSFLYGIDGSGKLNVTLDGKGLGQLNIGEYLIFFVDKGPHMFDLMHWDLFSFESEHQITIDSDNTYIKINATAVSNDAEKVNILPTNFESEFRAAY